jgi:hypothetical protein
MDKRAARLVGALSALSPLPAAATPPTKTLLEALTPKSYAELLQPVPNASDLLKEASASAPETQAGPRIETAQYYGSPYYYPDPYYNPYYNPRRRYHHHHHHNNYNRGWGWGPQPYYHHHHHHHHHHDYYWR